MKGKRNSGLLVPYSQGILISALLLHYMTLLFRSTTIYRRGYLAAVNPPNGCYILVLLTGDWITADQIIRSEYSEEFLILYSLESRIRSGTELAPVNSTSTFDRELIFQYAYHKREGGNFE